MTVSSTTINAIEEELLFRPATASDITTFQALPSATQAASTIELSSEYLALQVNAFFQQFLGRDPSSSELQTFVTELSNGATIRAVKSQILGSQEYFTLSGGTNDGFVTN